MTRYRERKLDRIDLVGRFEAEPSSIHVRNALAAIERLKDDGTTFWDKDSKQLCRWRGACSELWTFLNTLGERRDIKQQDLATSLREFIQKFEHSTRRMYQMLHGTSDQIKDNQVHTIIDWFDIVYRFSTYAIISSWIEDKKQEVCVKITVNLTTGERTEERKLSEMKVPKNYRCSTKKI